MPQPEPDLLVLADFIAEEAVDHLIDWARFQARMRIIAQRGTWVHGGGIQGVVVYHCPEAMR
ncbi:MAG TPA: hypothetical protein VHG72_14060 [Polyangia bacterium]|nr:hypothetical protein [Polyangia bacterium]